MKEDTPAKAFNISYTMKNESSRIIERTEPDEIMTIVSGSGDILPAVEEELLTMTPGDTRVFSIPPSQAYGEYDESKVIDVSHSDIPEVDDPVVGMKVEYVDTDGKVNECEIIDVDRDYVTIDFNHPLAGQKIIFEITLHNDVVEKPKARLI